jgi:5-methylcytosine-specific restriction enzyme subunit McrC
VVRVGKGIQRCIPGKPHRVNEQTGHRFFRDFLREDRQMAKLFEAFVANFYGKDPHWRVTAQERIPWDAPLGGDLLPEMHADAILRRQDRAVVVECKYYQETLQTGPWGGRSKLHSAHLYQLTSYLENLQATCQGRRVEGLLVYPVVGPHLFEDFVLSGKRVRACTLDLGASWSQIAREMKGFLVEGAS